MIRRKGEMYVSRVKQAGDQAEKSGKDTDEFRTRQLSPSSTKLAPTASHPSVPLPAMRKGWPSLVMSTSRVILMQSPNTWDPDVIAFGHIPDKHGQDELPLIY